MLILLMALGCSKDRLAPESPDNDKPSLSTDVSLINFRFKNSANPKLESSCSSVSKENVIYITVPQGIALDSLVPSFGINEKSSVKCGGKTIISDSSVVDFSQTAKFTVTSESGAQKTYYVAVKNGISAIDNKIYSFMFKHNIPGVSVSLSKDEEIVYSSGYGFTDNTHNSRITEHTMFRLASMSKQHASIAILTLMENGKLKLEDTVFGKGGLLYETFGDEMSEEWKEIKVENLLSHTSGITTDCIFTSAYSGTTQERVAKLLKNVSSLSGTGKIYSYNNSNFGILGLIVEKVSGKKFINFLKDEVYGPLGLNNIDGGNNGAAKKNETNYTGQVKNGSMMNPYGNDVEAGVAAGGVIASTYDLMKLMTYIDYGTKVPDIFKKETLDRMYAPLDGIAYQGNKWNRYALGWRTNHPSFSFWPAYHGGTLAGVATLWARGNNNINGVILCNSRSYTDDIDSEMMYLIKDFQDYYNF